MAGFQPINYNTALDTSQFGGFQQPLLAGNIPIGGAAGAALQPVAGAGVPTAGPGNMFSSLFGDGGIFSRNNMFGGTDKGTGISSVGWAPTALGVGQAIFGGIQGQKALGMAEDQLKEGKRQFNMNYGAQRQSMNTELEDRQRARVASSPTAYQGVNEYMSKNQVK